MEANGKRSTVENESWTRTRQSFHNRCSTSHSTDPDERRDSLQDFADPVERRLELLVCAENHIRSNTFFCSRQTDASCPLWSPVSFGVATERKCAPGAPD